MDWIQKISGCFKSGTVFYSRHAKFEMENENFGRIFDKDVYEAICSGEIVEEYLKGKPYPSVLIYGRTSTDRPLHIVCAYEQTAKLAIVITTYQPNPELWIDYKRRKKL